MCQSALRNRDAFFKTKKHCAASSLLLYPAVVRTSLDIKHAVHLPKIVISNVEFDINYCFRYMCIPYASHDQFVALTHGHLSCQKINLDCKLLIFHTIYQSAHHYWRIGANCSFPFRVKFTEF